jgi:hypothetical protein
MPMKKAKKLMLARETVRRLDGPELGKILGGVHSADCLTGQCYTAEVSCQVEPSTDP